MCHFVKRNLGGIQQTLLMCSIHTGYVFSECAAHTSGLSNFNEIYSGPVRPHLQSSGGCTSVHDWHHWPPALQLLRLSVALHLHP